MLILVGSTNPVKVQAAVLAAGQFEQFNSCEVVPCKVPSGVDDQPRTLSETMQGAINRARASFITAQNTKIARLGIGIEGGLAKVELTNTGYMNICAACIYDGHQQFLGISSGFEHPDSVLTEVFENGLEVSDAYVAAGLLAGSGISALELRQGPGAIGFMTLNSVSRTDYCVQALIPAFGALLRKELFSDSKREVQNG